MSECDLNQPLSKEVFNADMDNFFQIQKQKFGQDFKIDRTIIDKACRAFGGQEMIDEYISQNYPKYKPKIIEDIMDQYRP